MRMSGLRAIRFASFICVGHGGEMESPPADKLVELRAADTDRRQTSSPENETRLAATCCNTLQSVTASNALAEREKLVFALRL
mmetsp:Transcript_54006/g.121115  ORF Transcript_54006/g.121115 Transcript_54006/m.121115 type:complete len:83 (-) Transcript_54006:392-640(-)|eukprot:CAMPEP_0181205582 /NCGR_PEP_ID=MMETSP1096-20121128/20559_1 /TAXON_ID=156174 ORGANISM="Chrysochromulina ericina, Strain CCMP281" /NCGR_SAMPLE_ID=MMETSP1096 /ASSEMBLY_ACC=CAM_ASM_000453 /LENGTH=82 /DNA_ID=CAMNT_0023296385 /DNA_START=281 /DNA_END=529 /DNA_ORIENTATION=+